MRTLRKNQQSMYYALQIGEIPQFETDENGNIRYEVYADNDGNEFPILDENGNKIPMFTGEYETIYGDTVEFMASISMSGGEAEAVEYGLSVEQYSAIIITEKNTVPLTEGAIIWQTSTPEYKYNGDEVSVDINDQTIRGRFTERTSADFQVVSVRNSLNFTKYILGAINK